MTTKESEVDVESLRATAQAIREYAALFSSHESMRDDLHGFADSIEAALTQGS